MAITNRSFTSGFSILNLAGADAGVVKSVKGGTKFADVISTTGSEYYRRKQIGSPQLEPFTIQLDFSMSHVVYDWISASWAMNYGTRKNGVIKVCDHNMEVRSEKQFVDAMISEVTIPSMDAADREPAYVTIKIQPESLQYRAARGRVNPDLPGRSQQKSWIPQNFQLMIDGLDCSKVSRVDAFTVKIEMTNDSVGEFRDYEKVPAKIDFPNLRITFSEASAQTWIDWHESFVVQGNNGETQEKNGALIFKGPDLSTELGRIKLFNLGIFRLGLDDGGTNSDNIRRAIAELYCERMEFQYGAPTP